VTHSTRTWRCNQALADFADSIFDDTFGFPPTESQNRSETGHDGVFVVAQDDAAEYVEKFRTLCLRHGAGTGKGVDLPFTNIGISKGMDVERVLVWSTGGAKGRCRIKPGFSRDSPRDRKHQTGADSGGSMRNHRVSRCGTK
jgi:hypothetical protein